MFGNVSIATSLQPPSRSTRISAAGGGARARSRLPVLKSRPSGCARGIFYFSPLLLFPKNRHLLLPVPTQGRDSSRTPRPSRGRTPPPGLLSAGNRRHCLARPSGGAVLVLTAYGGQQAAPQGRSSG